jgi:uncharacterized lipoprotein NlpE involved in copper resistance
MCSNLEKIFAAVSITIFISLFSCSMDNFSTQLIGHYSGALPCADCPGITMELDLKEKAQYKSEMVYLERHDTIKEKGVWMVIKEKDLLGKNQTILELTSHHSSKKTYFDLKTNTTLQLLGADKFPVPSAELKKRVN